MNRNIPVEELQKIEKLTIEELMQYCIEKRLSFRVGPIGEKGPEFCVEPELYVIAVEFPVGDDIFTHYTDVDDPCDHFGKFTTTCS